MEEERRGWRSMRKSGGCGGMVLKNDEEGKGLRSMRREGVVGRD